MFFEKSPMWYSLHTHSRYSAKDALPDVRAVVARAEELNYPALGLTDHGNIAGSVQLYKECRARGIKPLPGSEMYLTWMLDSRPVTFHVCVLAMSARGYRNLVGMSTHTNRTFKYKPTLAVPDLLRMGDEGLTEGLVVTTGCHFGLLPSAMRVGGMLAGAQAVRMLGRAFDTVYVEVQKHDIDRPGERSEDEVMKELSELAFNEGLPLVITQDSHYTHPEHQRTHDALKELVSWSADPSEAVFPGGPYSMVDIDWVVEQYPEDLVHESSEALWDLYERADVVIPELDTFTLRVPGITGMEDSRLLHLTEQAMERMFGEDSVPPRYERRLHTELSVITGAGFAGYLLFVQQVCDWMREQGILFNARGSASGSLVCYLLGITRLDPVAWRLRFDRFLTSDRTKPPDVDLDVEHLRRAEVLKWIAGRYPMAHIGTWSQAGLDDDGKGSLRVKYFSVIRKQGKHPPAWEHVPDDDKELLTALSDAGPLLGYGTHAAGLFVAPDEQTFDTVPLQWVANSHTWITQYDKNDIEDLGLMKLDLLGLKTLTALKRAMDDTGVVLEDIPLKDGKTMAMLRRGDVDGVFQLEGYAARRGITQLRPRTIHHIIAAMALFRPATMDSGATQTYLDRMHKREAIPQRHDDIMTATKDTYGVLLYQEQVITVLRTIGFERDDLNAMLKAVKASNAAVGGASAVISGYMPMIESMTTARGWDTDDRAWLSEAIESFAGYSFNQAHATSYGLMSYWSAWMRQHHSAVYLAHLLSVFDDTDSYGFYVGAAKKHHLEVGKAHVNASNTSYTPEMAAHVIRKGLTAIPGVGEKTAEAIVSARKAGGRFTSPRDFASRVDQRRVTGTRGYITHGTATGVMGALLQAHAFDGLESSDGVQQGEGLGSESPEGAGTAPAQGDDDEGSGGGEPPF